MTRRKNEVAEGKEGNACILSDMASILSPLPLAASDGRTSCLTGSMCSTGVPPSQDVDGFVCEHTQCLLDVVRPGIALSGEDDLDAFSSCDG